MYKHILLFLVAAAAAALVSLVTGLPVDDGSKGEHVQHVTIPPSSSTIPSNSHIQRVPSSIQSTTTTKAEAEPIQQDMESSLEASSTQHVEETTVPQNTSEDDVTTEATIGIEEDSVVIPPESGGEDSKMPVDDLVTANFWWGLGPVYPHLYQFKRVPHLVPIHSWNPYHDYYTYHKKYPNQYSF